VNSSGVSTIYTAIVANWDSHSLTHEQIWILLKSFLKIFAKTIVPHAPRLLQTISEFLLLSIVYPLGIICFRHFISFKDYML
jgi:hypothetical protein